MRRIAIVGAGQAGLQLALGLRAGRPGEGPGHEVTLYAARRPEVIRTGRVLSTQMMFEPALALERAAGLHLWEEETPRLRGMRLTAANPPGTAATHFTAMFDEPARSVDQRVKTARWLELLEERGGRVEYGPVEPERLERIAADHDLTIVATGRGPLSEIFAHDERHSPYDRPQRILAAAYVHGMAQPPGAGGPELRINPVADCGEFFTMAGTTVGGPCGMLMWEALPGGPLDCWQDDPGPDEVVKRSLELLRSHLPWEYELCAGVEPTDAGAALTGAVTPTVRHPVAQVGAASYVLGMADAVVLNDPVAGQGANSAARCADGYLRAILHHGDRPFDRTWMRRTFAAYWEHARHVTAFSNMLLGPPPEHVGRVVAAAAEHPEVAHRYVNGYADPAGFQGWFMDADRADAYLTAVTGRTAPGGV
ncbi:styrene monooxygenase/indole monooxygenase family protein [Streptomyces sp. ISL-11]|uniref:styrene monooxygenase/indole monooxygenase family protein n=1 Tax=Streptomyces sp. ISL-11 TaxID=2819174 RepID=UPI001BEA7DBE|nr:styrene monooxygenase/indole monooxygenase family protein [Streptomyces sp. ISL-11]MBT2383080.1 FAD-binding oxidoreductase [Streptomyces sp. ISL-11]